MSTAWKNSFAIAALAALALAGCVVDTALKVSCQNDSDCLTGRVCDMVAKVCQSLTVDAGTEHAAETSVSDAAGDGGPDAPLSSDGPVEAAEDARPEVNPPADARDASEATEAGNLTGGHPNYAFITSSTTRTRFTPLDVADAFCQDAADSAELPGTYRAWISDATLTAIERFQGARGWVRPDGLPFADTLADLVAGRILYPLGLDENSKRVVDEREAYEGRPATGTTVDGLFDYWNSCIGWTSTDNTVGRAVGGFANAGGPLWDTGDGIVCSYEVRLICLGIDRNVPVSAASSPTTGRVGFITDQTWASGKGLGSADELCASEATAAKLPGTFKALLGSSTTTITDRLHMPNPRDVWVRPDGVALTGFSSFGVAGSFLGAAWDVTASGKHVTDVRALAGTSGLGTTTADQNCDDWTSTSSLDRALTAEILRPDLWMDGLFSSDCATPTRIMCLQDKPPPMP